MDRITWRPGRSSLRCGRCGDYSIDTLEDGRARCRSCGLTAVPSAASRLEGTRDWLITVAVVGGVIGAEFLLSGMLGGWAPSAHRVAFMDALVATALVCLLVSFAVGASGPILLAPASSLLLNSADGSIRAEAMRRIEHEESSGWVIPIFLLGVVSVVLAGFLYSGL